MFHRQGPVTAKLPSPNLMSIRGIISILSVDKLLEEATTILGDEVNVRDYVNLTWVENPCFN